MAKLFGRVCGRGGKTKPRGHRFLKITANGRVYDVTREFTGKDAPADRRKKRKPAKAKRKTSTYGRKRSGPLKGFASRKQKQAAMRNVKKAQKARRSRR